MKAAKEQKNKAANKKPTFTTPHEEKKTGNEQPKSDTGKAEQKTPKKGKLGGLLGHSVISVIRAMGKHHWDFEQAKTALDKAGIPAAQRTIKGALRRGRNGEKTIAPLSATELEPLAATPVKPKKQPKQKRDAQVAAPVAA